MGANIIVSKLNEVFSIAKKKDKHHQSLNNVLDKLREKEKIVKFKYENEEDIDKRNKQKHSLLVIKAQQNKAEKLLNI